MSVTGKLPADADRIAAAALKAVEPEALIRKNVSLDKNRLIVRNHGYSLESVERIFLVSIGKAAPYMSQALSGILGNRISGGIVLVLPGIDIRIPGVETMPSPHPLPDSRSRIAALRILSLADEIKENDLLLMLISGGGSSQISLPLSGISMADKRRTIDSLMRAGADIHELNAVRKHLSRIKGGKLAAASFPGTVIGLAISDVRDGDPSTIASGPLSGDPTTFSEASRILERYSLRKTIPDSVLNMIDKGIKGEIKETLKPGDPALEHVHYVVVGDNCTALAAAADEAERRGFRTRILTSSDSGEARDKAREYVQHWKEALMSKDPDPVCWLAGGELTVTVKGEGRGGRNQEFMLAVMSEMADYADAEREWHIMSMGSDGIDGPTDAAGACVSPEIIRRSRKMNLDPADFLKRNDSYDFFKQAGGLIVTGPTRTNVMDIRIFLAGPRPFRK